MTARRGNNSGNQGFVLIAVLGMLALLSVMMIVMLGQSRSSIDSAMLADGALRRDALVQSGIAVAAYELFHLELAPERVSGQQVRLDGGTVSFAVTTDAGKVDLNVSGRELLAAAYRASGLTALGPEVFAGRVVDWRDQDDDVSENGAEATAYAHAGLDHGPRNRAFRSVDDLAWVLGVSPADIEALRPVTTVFNPRGRLDVFAAAPALLSALPRVTPDTVEQALSLRVNRGPATIAALDDLFLVQASLVDAARPATYRVLLGVMANGSRITDTVEVVLSSGATAEAPYQLLAWVEKP